VSRTLHVTCLYSPNRLVFTYDSPANTLTSDAPLSYLVKRELLVATRASLSFLSLFLHLIYPQLHPFGLLDLVIVTYIEGEDIIPGIP
jgi:hypothetical protein